MKVNSGTIRFLPTIMLVATMFAESMHLDARLYFTTDGLMPADIIAEHAWARNAHRNC